MQYFQKIKSNFNTENFILLENFFIKLPKKKTKAR